MSGLECQDQVMSIASASEGEPSASVQKRKAPAYKQDLLADKISILNREIDVLLEKQLKKIMCAGDGELLEQKRNEKAALEKELQKTQANGKRQTKSRVKRAATAGPSGICSKNNNLESI